MSKVIRFNITPQTSIRATQSDRIFFRIPREQLYPSGLKRLLRLEKYNKYKEDMRSISAKKGFEIPPQGLSIKYYIPVPKSWRPWQKEAMHLKLHQQKPDIDNLTKAVLDSLRTEDKNIGHLGEISKHWVNCERGWIEFKIEKPLYQLLELPKRKPKNEKVAA